MYSKKIKKECFRSTQTHSKKLQLERLPKSQGLNRLHTCKAAIKLAKLMAF